MKVKCIKIYNETTKLYQEKSPWLTIGKEYVVLSIVVGPNRVMYQILDDSTNGIPGLHNAIQFQITSSKISKNWKLTPDGVQLFVLGPKAWEEDDFWDRCYDGDEEKLEIYRRETRIILEEEGML